MMTPQISFINVYIRDNRAELGAHWQHREQAYEWHRRYPQRKQNAVYLLKVRWKHPQPELI